MDAFQLKVVQPFMKLHRFLFTDDHLVSIHSFEGFRGSLIVFRITSCILNDPIQRKFTIHWSRSDDVCEKFTL